MGERGGGWEGWGREEGWIEGGERGQGDERRERKIVKEEGGRRGEEGVAKKQQELWKRCLYGERDVAYANSTAKAKQILSHLVAARAEQV